MDARDRDPAARPDEPRSSVPALGRGMRRPTGAYLASCVLAVVGTVLSHLFMRSDWIFALTVFVSAGGAGCAAIAFKGTEARAGWGAITLAVACVALVVIGSGWMAGRWGGSA